MAPSDEVFVLEEQGRAQPAGLHQGVVVDVVLIQGPLWARGQPEVVGTQLHDDAGGACGATTHSETPLHVTHTQSWGQW